MSNYLKYDVECLETVEALGDLAEAIKGAKAKYAEIEINAKNNLVFNKM